MELSHSAGSMLRILMLASLFLFTCESIVRAGYGANYAGVAGLNGVWSMRL
jgi:hypothetical protein